MPAPAPEPTVPAPARPLLDSEDSVEDFELAFSRLEWVRAASCLHLAAQRAAMEWHVACCQEALAAVVKQHPGAPADV